MFAKLRAGSGRLSRSWVVITAWWTLLARSIGCEVIEELCEVTPMVCRTWDGCSVTVMSRTVLTATETSAAAVANPRASTLTRQIPGVRSSRRNSPWASATAWRVCDEPANAISTVAAATRALAES